MKIIGYRLESEYENHKAINTDKYLMVVECCGLEIERRDDGWFGKIYDDKNAYSINIRTAHPTVNYFIIGSKRRENGIYMWLTKKEAEEIIEKVANTNTVDLRQLGEYQICYRGKLQTVMITNDCNEFDDEDEPLLVKIVNDKE